MSDAKTHKDFFISYTSTDQTWAEWIAWYLEEAGYSTVLQAWDFQPGANFVLKMDESIQKAERTIAVLSPEYLNGAFTKAEWAAAFRRDPAGEQGILLPVHVRECKYQLTGLLGSIIYIDLVGLDNESAVREKLLTGVSRGRAKPASPPRFPEGGPISIVEHPRFPGAFPRTWNVPYQRNPFFTGREDVLKPLYEMLRVDKMVALVQPRALTGLGGIGKTQTAVEYLYRYYSDYPEAILWVRANSRDALVSDLVSIADLLSLPEKNEQDQNRIVNAVKHWLKDHSGWLLVIDNIEDLEMVKNFIPSARRGHILLTTRIQAMGETAQGIEIEKMDSEEGALFLLRRTKFIKTDALLGEASEADRTKAREISQAMDGLPLALDQAGAYIEETQCSLPDYLDIYRTRREILLKERGNPHSDHPTSVTTTFSLSFEKIQRANPAAADLLRVCAFLAPDIIPEEIFTNGAPELGSVLQVAAADQLALNDAFKELLKYSLVRRNPHTKTLTIHRLVQAVLKDKMDKQTRQQWAERTVRAVNCVFPEVEVPAWPRCERYLVQAQVCATLIDQHKLTFYAAAQLLQRTGCYLREHARHEEAGPLLQRALSLNEKVLGSKHPNIAVTLHELGQLYQAQGRYDRAESFYLRALRITEKVLGPKHPNTATALFQLGWLYSAQGRYKQAESLLMRALGIDESVLGPEHPNTAAPLHELAALYHTQGRYKQAEPLYQRALAIREKELGSEHPATSTTLHQLGVLYWAQGRYTQAEPLLQRTLTISEKALGPEHPDVASTLHALAVLYHGQGEFVRAYLLYQRALRIREKVLGLEHPDTAGTLHQLAVLYHGQCQYTQAEPLYQQALATCEQILGPKHPDTALIRENYAGLLRETNRAREAAILEARAKMR